MKIVDQRTSKLNPPIPSENIAAGMVFRASDTKCLYLKTRLGIVSLETFHYFPDDSTIKTFSDGHLDVELVIKGVLPDGG